MNESLPETRKRREVFQTKHTNNKLSSSPFTNRGNKKWKKWNPEVKPRIYHGK